MRLVDMTRQVLRRRGTRTRGKLAYRVLVMLAQPSATVPVRQRRS